MPDFYKFHSMKIVDQIYLALAYKGTNVSAVARKMKLHQQSLHRKINAGNLSKEELNRIAKILGGKYLSFFSFPGGIVIRDKLRTNTIKAGVKKQ